MARRRTKTKRDGEHSFIVDLHGMRTTEARQMLDRELNAQFIRGVTGGRVICGHGKGVLLRVIGEELVRHPLVANHSLVESRAAYVVRLHSIKHEETAP